MSIDLQVFVCLFVYCNRWLWVFFYGLWNSMFESLLPSLITFCCVSILFLFSDTLLKSKVIVILKEIGRSFFLICWWLKWLQNIFQVCAFLYSMGIQHISCYTKQEMLYKPPRAVLSFKGSTLNPQVQGECLIRGNKNNNNNKGKCGYINLGNNCQAPLRLKYKRCKSYSSHSI